MIPAIVFSNNSPELLKNFLESAQKQNVSIFEYLILYNSDISNEGKYIEVFNEFNVSKFKKWVIFKEDLLALMAQGEPGLIAFFKDTNFFFKSMPTFDIEKIMSDEDIFCFSLGLGKNVKHCFSNDVYNILLNEEVNGENTIKWNWVKHYLDFGRPLELGAGHIFHKKEIIKLFKKWNYNDIMGLEESFDNLDYYPKEMMSSFNDSVLVDVFLKEESSIEDIKSYNFDDLDRKIISI